MCADFNFTFNPYGVFAAIASSLALLMLYLRIKKFSLPFSDFLWMFGVCAVTGVIGSRGVFVISRLPWLIDNFSAEKLLKTVFMGGFVFYGGLLGILIGALIYSKIRHLDLLNIYNFAAPAIPLFHAVGRVGCLLEGCCYGVKLAEPVTLLGFWTIDRVPTQLIEVVFELGMVALVLILERVRPPKNSLRIYMISYAVFRFVLEFYRGDEIRGRFFGVTTSQIISVAIILYYIVRGVITLIKRKRAEFSER